MKESIYIFSNGRLKRKDNTLFFESNEGAKKFIPVENIKEIYAFGEFEINTKALNFLAQKEIILHYFNYYDYYAGTFYPREHYNSGYMILKQVQAYEDANKRLFLAKKFIEGAIKNTLKVLKYYNRRKRNFDDKILSISKLYEELKEVEDIEKSMRIEGAVKEIYYNSFNKIIVQDDFKFTKRTRKPPKDYLNAIISFVNSLIYTYVLSEIYQTHLDPRIGFLHTTNFRRFSLNLDIAEIFKIVIGDRLIFYLINHGILTKKCFEKNFGGIILNNDGRKKVLEKMEKRLKETVKYKKLKKHVSYRRLIRLELYKLEKHLIGEQEYEPFTMEW
ncbi:MAG: subtype I-B CRISPR-associated endonuclease Cas1 [Fusobacteriia bacterium 4572_132]|nr:MAG: subtype I-B CRISPR-associated endonuclease Cas1 [Fusobacteriia bacterium 4572_132]